MAGSTWRISPLVETETGEGVLHANDLDSSSGIHHFPYPLWTLEKNTATYIKTQPSHEPCILTQSKSFSRRLHGHPVRPRLSLVTSNLLSPKTGYWHGSIPLHSRTQLDFVVRLSRANITYLKYLHIEEERKAKVRRRSLALPMIMNPGHQSLSDLMKSYMNFGDPIDRVGVKLH